MAIAVRSVAIDRGELDKSIKEHRARLYVDDCTPQASVEVGGKGEP